MAKVVQHYMKKEKIRELDWLSRSPGLNPIEHLWELVGRKVERRYPTTETQLESVLEEEWRNLDIKVVNDLIM
ncbi:unnamed protein product [Bursaphelenchus okinawaensis]|uniref:Tc1-like transposase DDE domain-containing protein n=1 Tax=Bursaphelenchus okinawaensis TaxID=465554 RepID=A0A811LE06_9BILA|nr:unnamed protein product [Bursaphelenchus okinawaensis]CAG9121316.1 unnamed protein product [Bursaphelenchus okinawaensis]